MHAFLRLQTLDDLADLIVLLKRGATVGIEPVAGSLFGPTMPIRLWDGQGHNSVKMPAIRYEAMPLDQFVLTYMAERSWFARLFLSESPDLNPIRQVWRLLNHAAGTWLSRIQIATLAQMLAHHYGGAVECQIGYGSPEWVPWVMGRHGWITLHHKPSDAEIREIIEFGAAGLINGVDAVANREWFVGMSGPYLMPDKGLIRYTPGMPPETAWKRSGDPSGISPTWDRVNQFYRLTGLVVPADASDEDLKAPGWTALRYAKNKGALPQDLPVRPVPVIPRSKAFEWVRTNPRYLRVDFTD